MRLSWSGGCGGLEDADRTLALASIGSVLLHEGSMRTITGEA